jgi:ferrochelatase
MHYYPGSDPSSGRADAARTALVLINLGTPAAPTTDAVREYLAKFLADPRVIEMPRWVRWMLVHGYILRTRPRHSAKAYARIWREDGSPLLVLSEQLAGAVRNEITRRTAGQVGVALAMTYGEPSLSSVITQLMEQGVRRLLALPLFPQYSATSTGAALDALGHVLERLRWMPAVRTIDSYYDEPGYLAALVGRIRAQWTEHGRGDKLLLSFHGIPEKYAAAGDPYPDQCHETARRLAQALGVAADDLLVTFQSRLGRLPWLRPYTDETVEQLARQGVETLDVACPGFAVDCLETLEEVALGYRSVFLTKGGSHFRYIPALNACSDHASALAEIAMRQLAGWV